MKMAHSLSSKSVSAELKRKSLGLIQVPSNMHHKGSSGRVVVIGGSRDYTGAPYFSAISAMRAGVDMATIVTTSAAAQSLKALSPDLIVRGIIPSPPPSAPSSNFVHGVLSGNASQHHRHIALPRENMRTSEEHCVGGNKKEEELQSFVVSRHLIGEITELLSKSHALIIGPGLASASMMVSASASSSSKSSSGKAHHLSKEEFAEIQKAGFGEEMCPLFVEWLRYYVSDGTYTCSSPHTSSSSSSSFTDLKALRIVPCIIDATGLSLLADALACRRRILNTSTNTTQEKKEEGGIDIIKPQETASDLSSSSPGSTSLPPIILTPNINEIKVLYQAALRSSESVEEDDGEKKGGVAHANHPEEMAVYVSKVMHCCVLLKGFHDFIAVEGVAFGHATMDLPDLETDGGDGKTKRRRDARGSDDNDDKDLTPCPRRVAGQGDVLSGLVGAFLAWQHIHKKMSFGGGNTSDSGGSSDIVISQMLAINATAEVAIGASLAMKHCCRLTEASAGTRRFLVSDIIGCVSKTVDLLAHQEN